MNVIGLDIAYRSTGIVALDYDTGALRDRELIEPPLERIDDNLAENLHAVARRVVDFVNTYHGNIYAEQPISYRSGTTTVRIGQMHGAIYAALHGAGHLTPRWWTAAEIKRHATGYGNAGKHEMVAAARVRWGVDLSHDEADAAWCASLGRDHDLATFGKGDG